MRNGAKTGARPLVGGGPFSKTPVFMCLCVRVHGAFFWCAYTFFWNEAEKHTKKITKKRQKIKQICQLFSIIRFCFRLSFFMSSVLEKR